MPDLQVQFVAFLSNVDHTVEALRLGDNFRIRGLPEEGGIALISRLEGVGPEMAYERAEAQFACLNRKEKKFFIAQKAYKLSPDQLAAIARNEIPDMTEMIVDSIKLSMKLSLARLLQGGDIRAPLSYGVIINRPELKRILKGIAANTVLSRVPFVLDAESAPKINEFIRTTDARLFRPYVRSAFKNFEESYSTHSEKQALTSLIASMEGIFHRPYVEKISEEIATNCATLIGRSSTERAFIHSNVRRLYARRSSILHEGSDQAAPGGDLLVLRDYVREAISKLVQTGATKVQLLEALESGRGL
ncbi:MAG: hypothetical protein JRN33_03025 [Nitrososphaerota archaeon]|nr:hypothetical protein [Nitrososphaerota archaeon]